MVSIQWSKLFDCTERETVIESSHALGHFGIEKTWQILRNLYWWPKMYNDVKNQVRCCLICQQRKPPEPTTSQGKLVSSFFVERPGQVVAWDIMGPIQASTSGKKYMLVMMDLFSHWVEVKALTQTDAHTLAKALWSRWISRYGPPEQLHSDKGRNITAAIIEQLCKVWNIKMTTTVQLSVSIELYKILWRRNYRKRILVYGIISSPVQ